MRSYSKKWIVNRRKCLNSMKARNDKCVGKTGMLEKVKLGLVKERPDKFAMVSLEDRNITMLSEEGKE